MQDSRAAIRYVKSLLGLAVERGVIDEVHQDMQQLDKLCKKNRAFSMMLRSPIVRHEKKRAVLKAGLQGKIHPLTYSIVDMITRKNREPLLPAIAAHFHWAYKDYKGIGSAKITTAVPLNDQLEAEISELVKKLSQRKTIDLEQKVNDKIIGGFVLDIGDTRIDASVRNKLHTLKRTFSSNDTNKE